MARAVEYQAGMRRHNGKRIGWAVWEVHPGCTGKCCPVTVAEFYGPGAKGFAFFHAEVMKMSYRKQHPAKAA